MTVPQVATLKSVAEKTAVVIAGVRPDQLSSPTPCSEWDVQRLVTHLVGWAENFADRAEGVEPDPNPDDIEIGTDPVGRFRAATDRMTAAMAADGPHPEKSPQAPMLIAEYVCHGSDLAAATGQQAGFTDAEAQPGLESMREMLKPEYRGHGFEAEVSVPDDAGAVDQLLAFSGRQP